MNNASTTAQLKPARIGRLGERVIAGVDGHYDMGTRVAIPSQWATYSARGYPEDTMVRDAYYGVCHNMQPDGRFDYMCGMQLRKGEMPPHGLTTEVIPAGNYAKFRCPVHISQMHEQWNRIMAEWLPASGYYLGDGPCVEFYGPGFDAATGEGGFELWVPVKKPA
ncbi:MAG: GyrI-like domain-containing protein [Paracoccaceae bacterium]